MSSVEVTQIHYDLHDYLSKHPLVLRYINFLTTHKPPRNTEPWHAVAERLYASACVNQCGYSEAYHSPGFSTVSHEQDFSTAAAYKMLYAPSYLWSRDMMETCFASPMPSHVIDSHVLPHPTMFHSFEAHRRLVSNPDDILSTAENNWIFLCALDTSLLIVHDLQTPYHFALMQLVVPYGTRFPDDIPKVPYDDNLASERASYEGLVGDVLRMLAFINSPYTTHTDRPIARHMHREVQRHVAPSSTTAEPLAASVITLRKPATAPLPPRAAHGHKLISHAHKWWVSGHYRAQWYPSRAAHVVIWIAPYLKGPSDAPVLEHTYIVKR